MIRKQILAGDLRMPNIKGMKEEFGAEVYAEIENMFSSLWFTYLGKGCRKLPNGRMTNTISLPYWAQRIQHPLAMNTALKVLAKAGWIWVNTRPNNNWSEAYLCESKLLEYVTQLELDHVRMYGKFNKYKLEFHNLDQDFGAYKMKVGTKIFTVDTPSHGFAKAGKVPFRFDVNAIHNNIDVVVSEVNKGIEKMITKYPNIIDDHANYKEIGKEVVESYMYSDRTYNAGPRTADPRKRNNSGYLNKIGNPVGFKVMRGLLVIPEEHRNVCTPTGLENKYLFIAELIGFKSGSKQAKAQFGRECYYQGTLAHCEVENVWIKRTYEDINKAFNDKYETARYERLTKILDYKAGSKWHQARVKSMIEDLIEFEARIIKESAYKWEVPIEIDMSASVIGYLGLLLNHKPFLDRCNILHGDLSDAWGHKIVTNRDQFKAVIMRKCYGSQQTAKSICEDAEVDYTEEELRIMDHELEEGEMAVANAFKDFTINNARMQPEMELVVLGDKVKTYCNKFHNVGEKTTEYEFFDSNTGGTRRIHNTETKKVPDLKSFKRYSVTGLIHGLDGRVMNNTVDAVIDVYGWCLDVHDADILCCEAANYAREIYANGRNADEPSLKNIHTHRNKILSDYFTSLNIPASALVKWKRDVVPLIQPLEEELEINNMVLK